MKPCAIIFLAAELSQRRRRTWRSQADLDAHLKMPHLVPLFSQLEYLQDWMVDAIEKTG